MFEVLARRTDLGRAELLEVDESFVRLHAGRGDAMPAESPPRATTPMWLVVGGGTLIVAGVAALVVAGSQRDDVRAAMGVDPGLRTMTRVEALDRQSTASTLDVVGLVGGGVGLALAGTGVLLGSIGGLGFQF